MTNKFSWLCLIALSFMACNKNADGSGPSGNNGNEPPSITVKNKVGLALRVQYGSNTITLAPNDSLVITGVAGSEIPVKATSVGCTAHLYTPDGVYTNTAQPVGTVLTWDLSGNLPARGNVLKVVVLPSDKYALCVQNFSTQASISVLQINYGLPSMLRYRLGTDLASPMIANNGVVVPVGIFDVVSPTSFRLSNGEPPNGKYWLFQNVNITGGNSLTLKCDN